MDVYETGWWFVSDGELNVLEDILTEAPDQDDELYNPESEREISDKKGTVVKSVILTVEKSLILTCDCEKETRFYLYLCDLAGTKRKNEHSDSRDLKRPRPSSRQGPSRSSSNNKRSSGPHLSSSSSKKLGSSPRGRHAGSGGYCHDYYEERKSRRVTREGTRSRGGEDMRRRESQRDLESLSQVWFFSFFSYLNMFCNANFKCWGKKQNNYLHSSD